MDSDQFSLKWNNFENNLATGFANLLEEESMVDVTIAVEGKVVHAHKIVLSVCSSYFKKLFQGNPCKHPIVILKDVGYQEVTDMLDFMYKGEAHVLQEDLPSFLKLAETLKIKGLVTDGHKEIHSVAKPSVTSSTKKSRSYESESDPNDPDYVESNSILPRRKKKKVEIKQVSENEQLEVQTLPQEDEEVTDLDQNDILLHSAGIDSDTYAVESTNKPSTKEDNLEEEEEDNIGTGYEELDTGPSSNTEDVSEMVPQDLEILTNLQGSTGVVLNGYIFLRSQIYNNTSYWRCADYKARTHYCHAKLNMKEEEGNITAIVIKNGVHNHDPPNVKVNEWRIHSILRSHGILDCEGGPEKIQEIILEILPDCPKFFLSKIVQLVTFERLKADKNFLLKNVKNPKEQ